MLQAILKDLDYQSSLCPALARMRYAAILGWQKGLRIGQEVNRVQTVFKRMQRFPLSHHLGKGNKMQSNVSYVVSLELNLLKHRRPIEAQQHKHQMYEVNPSHVCTCSESLMIIHVRGHRSFSHFPPLQNKAPGWRSHKLGTWLHRVHLLS